MKRILPLIPAPFVLIGVVVWVAMASSSQPVVVASASDSTIVPATTATTLTTTTEATTSTIPSANEHHDHSAMSDDEMGHMGEMGEMEAITGHDHDKLAPLSVRKSQATSDEVGAADEFVAATKAAVAPYADIAKATAAGFVPNKDQVGETQIHYLNPANRRDNRQLDPTNPEGLVYRHNADGSYALLGAVYTVRAGESAPTPGGPVFSWHTHDERCGSFFVPPGECQNAFRMLHVWTADGVVDPFTQPFRAALGRP